jgi:alkanesulfonate monooxygenase SsuD/methylene tetrahydromethanopterin reductase-like flavin-dependent oxidoreductase (luciferase family)
VPEPRQLRGSTGFALRDPYAWTDLSALSASGARLGYGALFLPEIAARDALAAITGLAGERGGHLLATGVVPLPSRTPQLLAMAAATAQERSGGRLVLGLGTGPSRSGALERLRRTVVALREVLRDGRAKIDGEALHLTLVPGQPPPVWIAALGPNAVRVAGEVADGVLLNWCTPDRVARARRELAEGAKAAGRDPLEVTVGVYVRACADADETASRTALAAAAAEYASYASYARQFASMGLGDEAVRASAAHRAGRPQDVPARLVDELCLSGRADEAARRLDGYRAAGADVPVVYPVIAAGADAVRSARVTLEAFAPGI